MNHPAAISYAMMLGLQKPYPAVAPTIVHRLVPPIVSMSADPAQPSPPSQDKRRPTNISRQAVLNAIREAPGACADIAAEFSAPPKTIDTHIARLQAAGLIEVMQYNHVGTSGRKARIWRAA